MWTASVLKEKIKLHRPTITDFVWGIASGVIILVATLLVVRLWLFARRLSRRCRGWHSRQDQGDGSGFDCSRCRTQHVLRTWYSCLLLYIILCDRTEHRRQSFDASTWRRHVTAHKLARGAPARAATNPQTLVHFLGTRRRVEATSADRVHVG